MRTFAREAQVEGWGVCRVGVIHEPSVLSNAVPAELYQKSPLRSWPAGADFGFQNLFSTVARPLQSKMPE